MPHVEEAQVSGSVMQQRLANFSRSIIQERQVFFGTPQPINLEATYQRVVQAIQAGSNLLSLVEPLFKQVNSARMRRRLKGLPALTGDPQDNLWLAQARLQLTIDVESLKQRCLFLEAQRAALSPTASSLESAIQEMNLD